jgi:hypothetical protein
MISWTTLESYRMRVGISLPIPNQAMVDGEEVLHEAQLWEETEEEFVIEENHAETVYTWLSERFNARSATKMLPIGMPESIEDVAVQTARDDSYGYIIFAPMDSLAESMKKMDVQVIIKYEEGFMKVGMGEAYTLKMLVEEYWYLTHQTWEFMPTLPLERTLDGSVVHGITWEWKEARALLQKEKKVKLPPKIVEDNGRGTLIRNITSQGKLLQYWARTQSNIEVGMFIPIESNGAQRNIEYWMNLVLPEVPNAQPHNCPLFLQEMCLQRLGMVSASVAQWLVDQDVFTVETRYVFNRLRVWFCPLASFGSRI